MTRKKMPGVKMRTAGVVDHWAPAGTVFVLIPAHERLDFCPFSSWPGVPAWRTGEGTVETEVLFSRHGPACPHRHEVKAMRENYRCKSRRCPQLVVARRVRATCSGRLPLQYQLTEPLTDRTTVERHGTARPGHLVRYSRVGGFTRSNHWNIHFVMQSSRTRWSGRAVP